MKTIEQAAQECAEKVIVVTDGSREVVGNGFYQPLVPIIAAAMREVCEPIKVAGVAAIEAASKYGATGYYDNRDDLKAEFASKGTIEIFEQLRAKANERDQLRARVAELEESVVTLSGQCTSLFNERETLVADRYNMDWLEMQIVEVRTPLVHGSRGLFCVSPTRGDGEERPSKLRAAIEAAKGQP